MEGVETWCDEDNLWRCTVTGHSPDESAGLAHEAIVDAVARRESSPMLPKQVIAMTVDIALVGNEGDRWEFKEKPEGPSLWP